MDRIKDRMTITMPPEVKIKLEKISKIERRSLSNMIHFLIEKYYLENKEKIKE